MTLYNIGPGETYETFAELEAAVVLAPSDIVDGGGNTFNEDWSPATSGDSGGDIFLQNANISATGNGITITNKDYITVQDITINGGTNDSIHASGNNLTVNRVTMNNPGNNGMQWSEGTKLRVTDSYVYTPGNSGFVVLGSAANKANDTYLLRCGAYDAVTDDGFTFHKDGLLNDIGANHILEDCVGSGNAENSYDITSGSVFTLIGCEGSNDGDATILVDGATGAIILDRFRIHDTSFGVIIKSGDVTIKKSLFYGTNANSAIQIPSGNTAGVIVIVNNTIVWGKDKILDISDPSSLVFKNNIWDVGTGGTAIRNFGIKTLDAYDIDYNIGYGTGSSQHWYEDSTTDLMDLIEVRADWGIELNTITTDPLLLSPGQLTAGSPALEAGTIIAGINDSGVDVWGNSSHRDNIGAYWGNGEPVSTAYGLSGFGAGRFGNPKFGKRNF